MVTNRQTKMWTENTEVRYGYDNLGRFETVSEWKRGGVSLTTPVETEYSYDKIGNVTSIIVTDDAVTLRETTNTFNLQRHWLVGVENKANGVVVSEFDYTRRADGQITKVEESVAQPGGGTETNTATFTYDALNRLTQEVVETSSAGGDYTKEYVLDLVGNRLTLIETKEGQSPVTTTSTYDARDRLLTETTGVVTLNYGYNANGSLTTKHEGSVLQSEQVWDVRGRLAGLKDGSGNWLSQYRYTPDGIRSSVTEGGTTTLHVIDVLGPSGYAQVIEERTAAGVVVGSYVYGPALDPLSQWRDGQGANLYLADGHSGVRQAVSLAGVVLLAQRFDAFGVTVASAGTLANVIGYRGERFDSTLGQYYLRARFYNPMSGRFTAMDPFAGNYGDPLQAMRYGYAGANPVGAMDPSGQFIAIAIGGLNLLGGAAGALQTRGQEAEQKGVHASNAARPKVARIWVYSGLAGRDLGSFKVIGHSGIFIEQLSSAGNGLRFDAGPASTRGFNPINGVLNSLKTYLFTTPGYITVRPATLAEVKKDNPICIPIVRLTAGQMAVLSVALSIEGLATGAANTVERPYGLLAGFLGNGVNCHAWTITAATTSLFVRAFPI